MAVKFTRSDDLDKMFEEFATLPKMEKVEFPEEDKKKSKNEKDKKEGASSLSCRPVSCKPVPSFSPLSLRLCLLS